MFQVWNVIGSGASGMVHPQGALTEECTASSHRGVRTSWRFIPTGMYQDRSFYLVEARKQKEGDETQKQNLQSQRIEHLHHRTASL